MVYRKRRSRKKSGKRFYRRGRKNNRKRLNKMAVGAPQSIMRRLRYQDYGIITAGVAGVIERDYFRLNNLYAPDGSGGSRNAQPRFYDQYMELYKYYVVVGAKVTVQFVNTDTAQQCRVGLTITDGTGAQTVGDDYVENERLTRTAILGVEGGASKRTLSLNWSAKKWFSHPNITAERDMEGTITSGPTTQAYVHIWTDDPWGYQPSAGVQYVVTVDYIVKFRTPKLISAS